MAKYYFVVNPMSGSGQGSEVYKKAEAYLKGHNVQYETVFSERAGHVAELVSKITAEHKNEIINLIILGGDGTLDEALQGVYDFSRVNIGYIPTGSGNDFARALVFSPDPTVTLKRILSVTEPKIFDLGKLEYLNTTSDRTKLGKGEIKAERLFDVSCGIGFEAAICERALESKSKDFLNKIKLGKLIYVLISLKLMFGGQRPSAKLKLDDGREIPLKKLRFVVGMNTCYEGGGYKFCPDSLPDDGYLDVCTVSDMPSLEALMVIPKASKGTHVNNKHVNTYHVKSYEVISDEPLWVHTDGEVYTKSSHIRVSVMPGILRFLM